MSASQKPDPGQGGGDPSMEDILASIRRILSEEEQPATAPAAASPAPSVEPPADEDVLVLEPSMIVTDPPASVPPQRVTPVEAAPQVAPMAPVEPAGSNLIAPETARAAAASVAGLVAALASERGTQVHRGGPTIEDLVRAEVRPILKEWLDAHLPPLVERLVRAEIERVVGRALP